MLSHRKSCYCAFCKSPQKIYSARSLRFHHFILSALGATMTIYMLRHEFHPSGFIIFILLLLICEIFIKVRWRMAIVCRHCGFDPVLYRQDINKTVAKVKAHLARRREDPIFLLSRPLNLPTVTKEKSDELIKFAEQRALMVQNAKNAKKAASVTISSRPRREGAIVNRQI